MNDNDKYNEENYNPKRLVRITTIDNPYNPFEDFNNWFLFDIEKGYYTCEKLGRLSNYQELMTEKEEKEENERVIDRLIEIDPLGIYKKVEKYIDQAEEDKKDKINNPIYG